MINLKEPCLFLGPSIFHLSVPFNSITPDGTKVHVYIYMVPFQIEIYKTSVSRFYFPIDLYSTKIVANV
jgi:hypothetical protein